MSVPFTNISSILKSLQLRALMLFSLILMFMAAHVYITSQPINSVVMAEILEEHEEEAHQFAVDSGEDFANPTPQDFLDFVVSDIKPSQNFLHLYIRSGVCTEDPPPPRG